MPAPEPGSTYVLGNERVTFRVTSAQSGGCVVATESLIPAVGATAPLHSHPPDELLCVLQGCLTLITESTREELTVGMVRHVPAGSPHAVANFSGASARALFVFWPGLMMERFFVEAGHPTGDQGDDVGRDVLAIAKRLGMSLYD